MTGQAASGRSGRRRRQDQPHDSDRRSQLSIWRAIGGADFRALAVADMTRRRVGHDADSEPRRPGRRQEKAGRQVKQKKRRTQRKEPPACLMPSSCAACVASDRTCVTVSSIHAEAKKRTFSVVIQNVVGVGPACRNGPFYTIYLPVSTSSPGVK